MNAISRRDFLSRTAYAGAGAVALSALPRASWANPLGLPIGIQLYAVSKPLHDDPAGTLKELYSIGYREVESAGSQAGMTTEAFRKLIDDAGLKCPSAHLQLAEGDLGKQFDQAHALGAHYAVSSVLRSFSPEFMKAVKAAMDSGGKIPAPKMAPMGLDDFKRTAERMNVVGKAAKAAGLQYTYHNHNFEFVKMPDGGPGYDVLLKETDPELVKFEVDCGWMVVAGGNPPEYFAKYPGRFRMLHIKDFKPVAAPTTDLMGKGRPLGTDLGTGFIDYGPIFAAAKSVGIKHIFVEQEAPFAVSQMASAKVDYAYLQKWS
ncbi:TIM barrel protein [Acidicapsa dinghuensis]|uniref:TIM barrel protein n=1 Tax=Acidicapsa dinghuensis TaxID=2218256 RepID=A0ABW1EAZ0_9BACT|nr:TIM barrel protein [Acidicapsa dinghuensis]